MPGDTIKVELFYTETIIPEEGIYEFVYPTVVGPRYTGESTETAIDSSTWTASPYTKKGGKSPYQFDINICLQSGVPIAKVESTSHQVNYN